MIEYRRQTCGVTFHAPDPPKQRCIAYHGEGRCCHFGDFIRDTDGKLYSAVAPPGCEIITFPNGVVK